MYQHFKVNYAKWKTLNLLLVKSIITTMKKDMNDALNSFLLLSVSENLNKNNADVANSK